MLPFPLRLFMALVFCLGKLTASAAQAYFGVKTFMYYQLTDENLNCNSIPVNPDCPSELSPSFLIPCLLAIVCNIGVVAVSRLPNLYMQTIDFCQKPNDRQEKYSAQNKCERGLSLLLSGIAILSVPIIAITSYFGAIKLLSFLASLSTKNKPDETWLNFASILISFSNFLSYCTYNISEKLIGNARKLSKTCCENSIRSNGFKWILFFTVVIIPTIMAMLFFYSFSAFFYTSHALQHFLSVILRNSHQLTDDMEEHANTTCYDTVNFNHTFPDLAINATNIFPPSHSVDMIATITLAPAIACFVLTTGFSTYNGLKYVWDSCYQDNKSVQHEQTPACWTWAGKLFWLLGIGDSLFSAFGGYIAVMSASAAINKRHIPFMYFCLSSTVKFYLAISSSICSAISNLAFNIRDGEISGLKSWEKCLQHRKAYLCCCCQTASMPLLDDQVEVCIASIELVEKSSNSSKENAQNPAKKPNPYKLFSPTLQEQLLPNERISPELEQKTTPGSTI